ncbi:hypothetical protein NDU88_006503 [Pleurodeles waltl]|uniref:Uncharacterized protein n=1 Tax=Pleurodeles waltl TaxID=8319 RepID=A0AAV7QP49_PLEWA|nr:hypothetical protein NDU88_006503 [Pleurodeles waltl]
MGRLRSRTGSGASAQSAGSPSSMDRKLDAVLEAMECLGTSLEQQIDNVIIRDRQSALQSVAAIGEPARFSDLEEGTNAFGSEDESLSCSRSEAETVTLLDVTPQTADDIV